MNKIPAAVSIVIVGASGHLAITKIFPALFALYCQKLLPSDFNIFGFARSEFSHEQFRKKITAKLTCRYTPGEKCSVYMNEFLDRCWYTSGDYASRDSFLDLYELMSGKETGNCSRLFYLAIPPTIFLDTAHAISGAGLVACDEKESWSRVVIEKPFGKDRDSSDELADELSKVFTESQTYRIDHYLGKDVIQNLFVLRFANVVFEPIWNNRYIDSVEISWKENLGIDGRGGYFDNYGIIRDVMQNHLMQILALITMEPPNLITADNIMHEKVKALKAIPPPNKDDILIGQYTASGKGKKRYPGYTEDDSVPDNSITPTFAAAKLAINNIRWQGVPFLVTAGKGLDCKMTEMRINFKGVPYSMFSKLNQYPENNQLIIRVQPDEAIFLRIANKVPGTEMAIDSTNLDLQYAAAFDKIIPDAYESLLLDVMKGDKTLFIRRQELESAWDIFSPALHEMDEEKTKPVSYPFGSESVERRA